VQDSKIRVIDQKKNPKVLAKRKGLSKKVQEKIRTISSRAK